MRRLLKTALLLPASLLLSGCRDARTSDVTGFWRMENFSRAYLPDEFKALTPTIHVVADHTFTATNFPIDFTYSTNRVQAHTFKGTWAPSESEHRDVIRLLFDCKGTSRLECGHDIDVDHGLSGHHLHYFLSDPDSGEAIQFERIQ